MCSHGDITLAQNVFLSVVNMRTHKYLAISLKLGVMCTLQQLRKKLKKTLHGYAMYSALSTVGGCTFYCVYIN